MHMEMMKVTNNEFNNKEIDIINVLYELRVPSSTNKVTEHTDYSWKTVDKYLKQLQEKGYVLKIKENDSEKWRLRTTEDEPQSDIKSNS